MRQGCSFPATVDVEEKVRYVRNSYPYAPQKAVVRRDQAFVERDLKD
jgi:hypothetical protein